MVSEELSFNPGRSFSAVAMDSSEAEWSRWVSAVEHERVSRRWRVWRGVSVVLAGGWFGTLAMVVFG